ncbi:MAG TPA: substrate-binding domain-containing protein [Planctomycetaceae bacterium]|nr:substrate-binding domain-containing protein [Planctomycetaceae bacterium]
MARNNASPSALLAVIAALALTGLWLNGANPLADSASRPLVVYCAHDAVYSEDILREFERQTGLPLDIRFDTEATKSLGLVQLLQRERQQPRCDVFWNNELLGTLDLQAHGLLLPYQGEGWQRMPERFRDADGHWVGFGARMRVWIVNTQQMSADESSVQWALALEASRVAMAQPMFGTTLTHYAVLSDAMGLPALQELHRDLRRRGLREVPGNGLVKDLVAAGTCDCGWTDTDDTFVALDAGAPVAMLPIEVNGNTIVIPNTAAIIRGTQRETDAQRLVNFLTSRDTELRLAKSSARQIPLGDIGDERLPDEVERLRLRVEQSIDLRPLLPARNAVLDWLRTESAP